MKMLLSMCLGLQEGDRHLADTEEDPLYSVHLLKSYQPKVRDLKAEIKRRAASLDLENVRMNTALKPACIAWLKENPRVNRADVEFLKREEGALYTTLQEAHTEAESTQRERLLNANWNSKEPWLRLYACVASDEARLALSKRHTTLDRDELDARNSDARPENFCEVVARKYCDPEFTVFTECYPGLHFDFCASLILDFEHMPGGAITPEDVKRKMTESRAKLMQVRLLVTGVQYVTARLRFNHCFLSFLSSM